MLFRNKKIVNKTLNGYLLNFLTELADFFRPYSQSCICYHITLKFSGDENKFACTEPTGQNRLSEFLDGQFAVYAVETMVFTFER